MCEPTGRGKTQPISPIKELNPYVCTTSLVSPRM